KDDFLNQRVIDHYGSLVPLTKLDDSLLRKAQNDTTDKKHKKDNSNDTNQQSDNNNEQSQSNDMNEQQPNETVNNQNNQQSTQQGQEIDTTAY
ncbi:TPA: LytR family transcriptional regulator, partial [Pseudomonas aeruginosa]|nr:LytR family transcriptional regulator [Pseudomonas aeruginosa]